MEEGEGIISHEGSDRGEENSFKWKGREREGKSYMKDKSERDLVLKSLLLVSLDLSISSLIQ